MKKREFLGIDIGGSGVKGAIVDLSKGEFSSERIRIPTPTPHTPESIVAAVSEIVNSLAWKGKIGCGFPGVVRSQIIETAVNLGGKKFVGVNLAEEIGRKCGREAWVLNDADAAGSAEMRFGAGKDRNGVVMMFTVGTGIGSSLFIDGSLSPNLELGQIKMRDKKSGKNLPAEKICSDATRKKLDLTWKQWAGRFNKYLNYVQTLFWPDMMILGGGVAAKRDKFFNYLDVNCDIDTAKLENRAGIIGAAFEASRFL